jgi:hypothetical protein
MRSEPIFADQLFERGVNCITVFLLACLKAAPWSMSYRGWRQSAFGFHRPNLKAFCKMRKGTICINIFTNSAIDANCFFSIPQDSRMTLTNNIKQRDLYPTSADVRLQNAKFILSPICDSFEKGVKVGNGAEVF